MKRCIEKRIDTATMPVRATSGSIGFDCTTPYDVRVLPGESVLVNLGIGLRSPLMHFYLELHLRSSMRTKHGLTSLGVGIIDCDYLDDIKILLHNTSEITVELKTGERIAQLIPHMICGIGDTPLDDIRIGGFGSTGK